MVKALSAAANETDYNKAVVKSYKEMPDNVTVAEWEGWFKKIHDVSAGAAIQTKDLIGYEDSENKRANRLRDLLNLESRAKTAKGEKGHRLLPETVAAINATKKRLVERGETLNDAQINALIDSIESALFVSKLVNKANALRKRAKMSIKAKLGSAPESFPVFNKLVNIDMRGIPIEYRQKYIEVLQELADPKKILDFSEHGELLDKAKDVLEHATATKPQQDVKDDDLGEKSVRIKLIKSKKVDVSKLATRFERDAARLLQNLTEEDLDLLNNRQLQHLIDGIEAIKYGVLPHAVFDIITDIDANRAVSILTPILAKGPSKAWSQQAQKLYGNMKSALLKSGSNVKTNAIAEIIRSSPKTVVDEVFGNRTSDIYDNVYRVLGVAEDRLTSATQKIMERTEVIEKKLGKKFKRNARVKIKFKLKLYEKQLESESNPDTYNAMDYVKRIYKDVKEGSTNYTQRDVDMIKELVEEFTTDGVFDLAKLEASMTPVEKEVIKHNRDLALEMQPLVEFTSGVIRGERVETLNNYSASSVVGTEADQDLQNVKSRMVGTAKSRNLQERFKDGENAPLISLDVTGDAARSAVSVLRDFHLTPAIRQTQRTVKRLKKNLAGTKGKDSAKALELTLEESIDSLIANNFAPAGIGEKVIKGIIKASYLSQLASAPRAIAETISNVSAAVIFDHKALMTGLGSGSLMGRDTSFIYALQNLGSTQLSKMYDKGAYGGKFVETSFTDLNSIKRDKALSQFEEGLERVQDVLSYAQRPAEALGEILISAPDKVITRAMYWGKFQNAFKELTGQDPDLTKIAANDEAYMQKFKNELSIATKEADRLSVQVGATNNKTIGIQKYQFKSGDSATRNAYRAVNGYLMRFMTFEAATFRSGYLSAMNGSKADRVKGAKILVGATTRMAIYFPMYQALASLLSSAFFDDEEEEDPNLAEELKTSVLGSLIGFITQGRLGAVGRSLIAWPIEQVNKEYIERVLGEEYNPFKDSLVYSPLTGKGISPSKIFQSFSGPLGPLFRDLEKLDKDYKRANRLKDEDKREAAWDSFRIRGAGILAQYFVGVPFYKDIIRIWNEMEYANRKNR